MKACANRGQDWIDIEGILVAQAARLERQLVESQLALIKDFIDYDQILPRLLELFQRHQSA